LLEIPSLSILESFSTHVLISGTQSLLHHVVTTGLARASLPHLFFHFSKVLCRAVQNETDAPDNVPSFVCALKDIHARQRKLMRAEYSQLSHLLALAKELPRTRREMQSDMTVRQTANEVRAHSTADLKDQLSKAEVEARTLRAVLADLTRESDGMEHEAQQTKVFSPGKLAVC
jgi:hypothetical protein